MHQISNPKTTINNQSGFNDLSNNKYNLKEQYNPISKINKIKNITENKKIWIEKYGCSASMADSEMISGLLQNAGYKICENEKEASLSLIVTCSVKDATEHKMLHRIDRLHRSGKPLIVAGCLPKADIDIVQSLSPSASLLGPHSIDRVVHVADSTLAGTRLVILDDSNTDKVNIPRIRLNPAISIIEIASGCLSECSFCQTKLAKGWLRSYRIGDILRQIQHDIHEGCREIWLTSTDNGCYGRDTDSNLVKLLRACCSIKGDFKIRVGMMNPMYLSDMMDDLVNVFAENDKIFKFLHIPVQSGSNRILRKMKRGHTAKTFQMAVTAFRSKIPEMTIATDIIVGFPSETEQDFYSTIRLLKETQPDIVNSSKFSSRRGTVAFKMKQLGSELVKSRTEILHKVIKDISADRNSIWKNWSGKIIIDEIGPDFIQGRNYAYKPVIIKNHCNEKNHCIDDKLPTIGSKVNVKIYNYSSHILNGVIDRR